jgi:hypothetical protein
MRHKMSYLNIYIDICCIVLEKLRWKANEVFPVRQLRRPNLDAPVIKVDEGG